MKMTPEEMSAADILEGAAGVLDVHGWGRGRYYRVENGHYCVIGAMRAAIGMDEDDVPNILREFPAFAEAVQFLALQITGRDEFMPVCGITGWNDFACKGEDQATDTLRLAAKNLRNEAVL
jgi:hypothetical protein